VTCRQITDFLMEYLEGALPPEQRREFERHLAVCPSCVAYLDSYRRTAAMASELGSGTPDHAIPEPLVHAILAAAKRA
jgi:anti-sigma factor RsiW